MANVDIVLRAQNRYQAAFNQANAELRRLQTTSASVTRAIGTGLRNISIAGVAAGTAAGVGVVRAVNVAGTVEQTLANTAAVLQKSLADVQPLADTIDKIAINPNLRVTALQTGQAIEVLAKNGLNMTEIVNGAAEATVLLQNATGGSFAQAADIATDAMTLFNIGASDMLQSVNGITSVTNNSKFDINDYALALAQAGGVASETGVGFGDFNASIAAIAPLFASGSDAGTSFKTFLQQLTADTKPAIAEMKALGLITEDDQNRFFTASGEMRSMAEVAGLLSGALSGLSEQQRSQALETIFGTDAMRAAAGLARFTESEFDALLTTMGQTDAIAAAETRMNTYSGAVDVLQGVMESITKSMGDSFLPLFTRLAQAGATFLSANAPAIATFFDGIASSIEAGLPQFTTNLLGILSQANTFRENIVLLFQNILPTVQGIFQSLSQGTFLADSAQALGRGLAAVLGSAFTAIQENLNFETIRSTIGTEISNLLSGIDFGAAFDSLLPNLFTGAETLFSSLGSILTTGFQSISGDLGGTLGAGLANALQGLTALITGAISGILEGFDPGALSGGIVSFVANFVNSFVGELTGIDLSEAITGVVDQIKGVFEQVNTIVDDVSSTLQGLTTLEGGGLLAGLVGTLGGGLLGGALDLSSIFAGLEGPDWASIVTALDWASIVPALSWTTFVTALSWASFVASLSWGSFIGNLSWGSFIPSISWGSFVPSLSWSSFVSSFSFGGGGNALGGPVRQSGVYRFNEFGQEAVVFPRGNATFLPRGAEVIPANQLAGAGAGGPQVSITIPGLVVRSEADIDTLARAVAQRMGGRR